MKGGRERKRKRERAAQETQVAENSKILCESSLSTDAEEIFEEESEDSGDSNYFTRVRKQKRQNSRRKIRSWTSIEEEIFEEENGDSGASNYSTRVRKQKCQNSRRKTQPWTSIEEETIENGVRLYWTPHHDKPIPWKRILKFGKGKFQPCRTNIDLKDKWRNLHGSRARARPKSEGVPSKYRNPIELSSNSEASQFFSSDKTKIKNKNTKKKNKEEKKEKKEKKIGTLGGRPINEIESEPISDGQMFDPMKELSGDLVGAFKSWHDLPRSKKRKVGKVEIRLPIAFREFATAQWFDCIWIRRKWLSNEHVDSLLNLLIMKANNEPGMFLPRWTCVETICWYKMGLDDFDLGSWLMMKYVEGKLPRQGGKAWCEVDNIYGIAHLMDSHWVAYEINIEDQRITVYDSLSHGSRWDEVKPAFENLSRCVPWLCRKGRVMEDRGFSGRLKEEWELLRYEHPPQQENISDCGIMAIKFIECLVSGRPLDYINPKLCGDFRSYFCAELFDGGQKV